MECEHSCGIDTHKRQADRTLLFEYIINFSSFSEKCDVGFKKIMHLEKKLRNSFCFDEMF